MALALPAVHLSSIPGIPHIPSSLSGAMNTKSVVSLGTRPSQLRPPNKHNNKGQEENI